MARRRSIPGFVSLAACLMLAGVMGGCGTGNQISKKKFQIKPGETAEFSVNRKTNGYGESALVHLQVQAVTPSWKPDAKRYWMELITEGPVKIVVRGEGEKLDFETGAGEVARIPGRAVKKKFEYHVAGAPVDAE
ncbi:MAG: hypothetical protein IID28_10485 [Planctomycetes bacterium]|nr:hypothetical protein [Planctomycetota bacterium]